MADSRSSILGSISPWSISRSSSPPVPPPVPRTPEPPKGDLLRQSSGLDHAISLRPSLSLRRYPKDCPPSQTRWYYAVDVAKRKPFATEPTAEDKVNPALVPKKLVAFSVKDSQSIEDAFQELGATQSTSDDLEPSSRNTSTKVPVNEDFLFDVHIEKRELEPAYWLGPVYEVRRGSWFYQEGATLRPCDENLANQIEEGYLKVAPWRRTGTATVRSSSQPRARPVSTILDGVTATKRSSTPKPNPQEDSVRQNKEAEASNPSSHRLFGAHMGTTVTYQDGSVAYLTSDDFISRMSISVYGTFGSLGGTKVVRGYSEIGKAPDTKPVDPSTPKDTKRKSANTTPTEDRRTETRADAKPVAPKRTALERQLSSLAGLPEAQDSVAQDEEDARQEEEKEMVDARDTEGEDQGRQIDHLLLVTHGIGQRLGLRLDSINFVHDVNTLRKSMKMVYGSAPDLQALNGSPSNCGIQVLPICWRHLLDFPKQGVRQNRKESDLGDADSNVEEEYPSLQDITVEGIPYVRALTSDLVLDVLLYQSKYREYIAVIVQKEINRVLQLFKQRTGFSGKVSLCGHSLGSAILFDILCRQRDAFQGRQHISSRASKTSESERHDLNLNFDCENFFCLGSPIALFQMLKGRTIAGRTPSNEYPPESPFDLDRKSTDFFSHSSSKTAPAPFASASDSITTSSPKCAELFNIFHPTDPIAYRIEPLISSAMAQLKPQQLPYTKKSLFAAPGIANISARVSQQVMSSWYNLTSGVASTLINRSLGLTGDEQAFQQDKVRPGSAMSSLPNPTTTAVSSTQPLVNSKKQQAVADAAKSSTDPDDAPTLIDSDMETLFSGFQKRRLSQASKSSENPSTIDDEAEVEKARKMKREEAKVRALNSRGRVDYSIQEGAFDISLLASIASHLSYWADEDVNHFMIGQMLRPRKTSDGERTGSNSS